MGSSSDRRDLVVPLDHGSDDRLRIAGINEKYRFTNEKKLKKLPSLLY